MFSGEAANTNFIDFWMTRPGLEPTIYHTHGEHVSHHNVDTVVTRLCRSDLPTIFQVWNWLEEFEDPERVIRIRKSKKNTMAKVEKDKQRSTKHMHKTKDRVTRIPLKTGCEIRFYVDKVKKQFMKVISITSLLIIGSSLNNIYYYCILQPGSLQNPFSAPTLDTLQVGVQ